MVPVCLDHLFGGWGELKTGAHNPPVSGKNLCFSTRWASKSVFGNLQLFCLWCCIQILSAIAPGGVANDAFVFKCNSHKEANTKQDRCLHHKMNQWPPGGLGSLPYIFFSDFFRCVRPTRHCMLHQGDSWLNKTKGSLSWTLILGWLHSSAINNKKSTFDAQLSVRS